MKLNAPSQVVFIIAVIIAIIGLLAFFSIIPIAAYAFWIMTLAFVVLAVGCLLTGM